MADKDMDNVEDEEATIATDLVVTKYKMAAEIVNDTMKKVIEKCIAGAKVTEICAFSDNLLLSETGKVFKKEKEMKKGISFPTCISVNNCIGHFSPLTSDPDLELKDGDVVKIDMGTHIDGFPAVLAHTFVIGASKTNKVTGKKADAVLAAHYAAEAALRMVAPGKENYAVTDTLQRICETYHCKPMEGVMSHQLKQHVIDGEKVFILNPTDSQKKDIEKCEFDVHEVYAVDVVVSTGEGKGRIIDTRTTIYKRKDLIYQLKMKLSRQFFSDVEKKFGFMPFNLRMMDQETKARMGVKECVEHGLLEPFPVAYEKEGEFVTQFKYTLLLMPNSQMRITQGPALDIEAYESQYKIEDAEIQAILNASTSRKAAKNKKKKAEKASTAAAADGDAQ